MKRAFKIIITVLSALAFVAAAMCFALTITAIGAVLLRPFTAALLIVTIFVTAAILPFALVLASDKLVRAGFILDLIAAALLIASCIILF